MPKERYENICMDKVRAVAWPIAVEERRKNPEVPICVSPTAFIGEGEEKQAARFRVDRVIIEEVIENDCRQDTFESYINPDRTVQ